MKTKKLSSLLLAAIVFPLSGATYVVRFGKARGGDKSRYVRRIF